LDHLLGRILYGESRDDDLTFTSKERNTLIIVNDRMYRHKVLRVNYTTYDMRRAQDTLNPRTQANVMVLSKEDPSENGKPFHPYWYARIIDIFHLYVVHIGPLSTSRQPQKMEVLFVRWYGSDSDVGGWKNRRLHRIGFVDNQDDTAFGFLDPSQVVRGVHLIPAFAHGRTKDLLSPSITRPKFDHDEDWLCYYVGM
jgi:hypothetical protein